MWQSVNHIPGIHDNGPRDHGVCLTLTAYSRIFEIESATLHSCVGHFQPSAFSYEVYMY